MFIYLNYIRLYANFQKIAIEIEMIYKINGSSLLLDIKAIPRASKTEFAGLGGEALRVRIAAAPERGKANDALCDFLADSLGCPRRMLSLAGGEKSAYKTIAIPPEFRVKLDELLENQKKEGKRK